MFKKHRQICSIPKNAKKLVINITVMDTRNDTIDCHYIIDMLNFLLLEYHASFKLYDKKLTKSTLYQLSA